MITELAERNKYNWWELVSKLYCVFILAIFPLTTDSTKYNAITIFKFRCFEWSAAVYATAVLGILIYIICNRKQQILQQRKSYMETEITWPQLILMAYVCWCALSALRSPFRESVMIGQGRFEGLLSAITYAAVFMFVSMWGEHTKWYWRLFSITAIIFGFIAVLQLFYDGIIYPENYKYWNAQFMSTLGNIDVVAGFAVMSVAVMFCSYSLKTDKKFDWVFLAGMFIIMFLQVVSDVDSGKIGFVVAFLFALPFVLSEKESIVRSLRAGSVLTGAIFLKNFLNLSADKASINFGKKTAFFFIITAILAGLSFLVNKYVTIKASPKKMRRIVLFAMIAIMLIGIIALFFYNGNNTLVHEISEALHFRLSDQAGSGRGYIWKTSVMIATKRPVFGYGPGCFLSAYKDYDTFATITDFAHNDFIQILVCTGFISLALYCAFIISLAVRALKVAPKCPFIIVAGSACAGYLAHSFFSFSIAIITPIFWVIAGILDKLVRQIEFTEKISLEEGKTRKK